MSCMGCMSQHLFRDCPNAGKEISPEEMLKLLDEMERETEMRVNNFIVARQLGIL